MQAIDTSKEPVDGGRIPEPLTDGQLNAIRELRDVNNALGWELCDLVHDVLGERLSIRDAAIKRGAVSAREVLSVGYMFNRALNTMAVFFGYAGIKADRRARIKAWREAA